MVRRLYQDTVVAEIHAIRDKMLEDCDGDRSRHIRQVRARQKTTQRNVIPAAEKSANAEQGNRRQSRMMQALIGECFDTFLEYC